MSTSAEDMGLLRLVDDDESGGEGGLSALSADVPDAATSGGLTALDDPIASQALQRMLTSANEARTALRRAREQIVSRRYNRALPWFAVSEALSKPTRTGAFGEVMGNLSAGLAGPLREREAFEQAREKELLGLDLQSASADQQAAQAQLKLAELRARLKQQALYSPNDIAIVNGEATFLSRPEARNKKAYTPPSSQNTVNVSTQKNFMDNMGEGASKMYADQFQAALKAPQELERNVRIRELLQSGAYTGMGANWKLNFDRVLNAAGIDFGGDKIANTEQLVSELSAGTLALIKPSGLGGGTGFSNADREFLAKVAGGEYTLNRETLLRLSKLHDRAQRNVVKTWNDSYGRLAKVPGNTEALATMGYTPLELPAELDESKPKPKTRAADTSDARSEDAGSEDEAPAVDAPYGLAPEQWAIDPANRPPRAAPEREQYLKEHPETAQQFLDHYGYLPQ